MASLTSDIMFLIVSVFNSRNTSQIGWTWNLLALGDVLADATQSSRAVAVSSLSGLPSILVALVVSPPRQSHVLFCDLSKVLKESLLLISTPPAILSPVTEFYYAFTFSWKSLSLSVFVMSAQAC